MEERLKKTILDDTHMNRIKRFVTGAVCSDMTFFAGTPASSAQPMPTFARGGKAAYSIVVGCDASDAELLAMAELSMFMGRVTSTVMDGTF